MASPGPHMRTSARAGPPLRARRRLPPLVLPHSPRPGQPPLRHHAALVPVHRSEGVRALCSHCVRVVFALCSRIVFAHCTILRCVLPCRTCFLELWAACGPTGPSWYTLALRKARIPPSTRKAPSTQKAPCCFRCRVECNYVKDLAIFPLLCRTGGPQLRPARVHHPFRAAASPSEADPGPTPHPPDPTRWGDSHHDKQQGA